MRRYELIAMSALLLAAEDPSSDMSNAKRAMVLITNEMAMVSVQGAFARSNSAKLKWLGKLDRIEADINNLLAAQEQGEELTEHQLTSLQGTRESIAEMREALKAK